MKNNLKSQALITAALNSLDGIRQASPGPFFYTRVQARLNRAEKNIWEKSSAFLARPLVAFSVIFAVILMNSVAIFQHNKPIPVVADQSDTTVYEEFNLASNSFYDYETIEP